MYISGNVSAGSITATSITMSGPINTQQGSIFVGSITCHDIFTQGYTINTQQGAIFVGSITCHDINTQGYPISTNGASITSGPINTNGPINTQGNTIYTNGGEIYLGSVTSEGANIYTNGGNIDLGNAAGNCGNLIAVYMIEQFAQNQYSQFRAISHVSENPLINPKPSFMNGSHWHYIETNAGNEGSFIAHNGDTMVICNPADNNALNFRDEDDVNVGW